MYLILLNLGFQPKNLLNFSGFAIIILLSPSLLGPISKLIFLSNIWLKFSKTSLTELISESGYSKIPVIGESIDDVKGIVYAKDTLKMHLGANKSLSISEIQLPSQL